ncbi:MAG TPA: S9 family peptidase [Chloroflexia bacterium]|nr:S9 family peptidase [Chloroflexia bacterium]
MSTIEKRPVRPEDLNTMKFLGEVTLAPDARQLFYDVFYVNQEKNIYQGEIWQLDLTGKEAQPRRLTAGPRRDSQPRLSPDGTKLAFLSDRGEDNKKQLFVLELGQPGEARQLTRFRNGANSFAWSGDSRYLAVLTETPDDADKASKYSRPESPEERREREAKEQEEKRVGGNPVTFDRVKMRADGRRSLIPGDAHVQIWLVDSAAPEAEPRQLTSGPFSVMDPAFSPDGRKLVFSSTRDQQQADFTSISDLWLIEPFGAQQEPLKLTGSKGPAHAAVWSPDGTKLSFVGHTHPKDGSYKELPHVWVLEVNDKGAAGEPRCLTTNFDRHCVNLVNSDARASKDVELAWSKDSREIFFAATDGPNVNLFRVPADGSAEPTALTTGQHQIYGISAAPQADQVAYTCASWNSPGDVYIQSLEKGQSEARRLTELNRDWLSELYFAEPETIRVPSADGTVEIEGWLMKPQGFDPSKKYPLLLEIHGGPHTAYGHSFYQEFQMLAGQGYVVLYTNPRGSVGYGYDFGASIYNDWGHHDYDDIMAAVDYVIGQGYIDTSRMGVTGGSYGGYMTNWIIGHTDRFKAALSQRCVSNLVTMYTLSDISFGFVESEFEGDIWSNPRIWECSPMAHANKVKTPTLLLHSEADFRCPIEQAEEFFFALKRNGCEVQLVKTPGEDHNLSRSGSPDHRVGRLRRISEWFEKYLSA